MPDTAPPPAPSAPPDNNQLLATAIGALTDAARAGLDWAEFVTLALAGAAANIGGVEEILAVRSGSWEADGIRNLLRSTVGNEIAGLLSHRTEPFAIELHPDDILTDLGVWDAYDAAAIELDKRYPTNGAKPLTNEQEKQLTHIAELENRLEQQRADDWSAYGVALKDNVVAAVASLEGLNVPVLVTVEEDPAGYSVSGPATGFVADLLAAAIEATPIPGDGRPPLARLEEPAEGEGPAATRPEQTGGAR